MVLWSIAVVSRAKAWLCNSLTISTSPLLSKRNCAWGVLVGPETDQPPFAAEHAIVWASTRGFIEDLQILVN
jgi:hypothetical protein